MPELARTLADSERGRDDGAARMRDGKAVRIVGFVGMGEDAVGQGGDFPPRPACSVPMTVASAFAGKLADEGERAGPRLERAAGEDASDRVDEVMDGGLAHRLREASACPTRRCSPRAWR